MTTPVIEYQPAPLISPGRAKLLLALLIALNLFNYADRYVLAAVESRIGDHFHKSASETGLLAFAFLVVYMVTAPIFGWAADRWSRWALVGVGMLIQALATGGSGLSTTFGMLLTMRCLVGIGDAAYGPAAPTLLSDLFPVENRGRMLAWFYAAMPVGSAVGYVIGGGMLSLTGSWRSGFFALLIPMLLLGGICFLIPDRRHLQGGKPPKFKAADAVALLRNRSYTINCIAMTALTFAIGGIAFFMPRYLTKERGLPEGSATTIFGAIICVAGLTGTIFGGWLGDRLRAKVRGSYFAVSATGMFIGAPLLLLLLITPFPAAWLVLFAAMFAMSMNTGPGNTAIANVTRPAVRATAFAANIFVVHALGDAISPLLIGGIADHANLSIAFAAIAVVIVIGGVAWLIGMPFLDADTTRAESEAIGMTALDPAAEGVDVQSKS